MKSQVLEETFFMAHGLTRTPSNRDKLQRIFADLSRAISRTLLQSYRPTVLPSYDFQ